MSDKIKLKLGIIVIWLHVVAFSGYELLENGFSHIAFFAAIFGASTGILTCISAVSLYFLFFAKD